VTKKGELEEWVSRINYGPENPHDFSIIFRDFNKYVELSFEAFMIRSQEDSIHLHRISQIRKNMVPVFTRPNFCTHCGNPLKENKCNNSKCSFAKLD
jgi:uncharacterized protein (UPF0248 family)